MDIYSTGQKILAQLENSKHVVVATHRRPDPDAIGSTAAFCQWLKLLNVSYTIFCLNEPDENLLWLLNYEAVVTSPKKLLEINFDTLAVLDCADLKHPGIDEAVKKFEIKPTCINIDHHFTNVQFGDINLVNDTAVSTTEILYHLFKAMNVEIKPLTASALLSGIVGDTYNYTNPNTNKQSLEISSKLLRLGASMSQVTDSILKNKSIDALQTWGTILIRLHHNKKYGVAVTAIDTRNSRDDLDVAGGIANFLNNLSGIKASLVLQQTEDNVIKGSLRTNDDLIDVSKLAKILGGGGHKKAAGFQLPGRLQRQADGSWKII